MGEKTTELWKNPEYREHMKLAHKGQVPWIKGRHRKPPKTAFKIGQLSGDKHPNWQGGITPENLRIRRCREYKLWRTAVFERDNYTCVFCGIRGGYLEADHIKSFAHYPELRLAIDNGRTLCKKCHRTTESYSKNTRKNKCG